MYLARFAAAHPGERIGNEDTLKLVTMKLFVTIRGRLASRLCFGPGKPWDVVFPHFVIDGCFDVFLDNFGTSRVMIAVCAHPAHSTQCKVYCIQYTAHSILYTVYHNT